MKNIAIVTWIGMGNFGTSLQSYALHQFLKEKGYGVVFLHQFSVRDLNRSHRFSLFERIYDGIRFVTKYLFIDKFRKTVNFNKRNYCHCYIKNIHDYNTLVKNTDVFLTGSDQIWNCYNDYNPFMFLDFVSNVKKIAYASSIGTAHFPNEHLEEIKNMLCEFSHIGVRENASVAYLDNLLERKDVVHVQDPTFLLNEISWKNFAKKGKIEIQLPKNYILCYFVGNRKEYEEQLKDVRKRTGIKDVIVVPSLENKNIEIPDTQVYKKAGPYEFVRLISSSSLVCTDSFHACAISINLSKDFVVFKRFDDSDDRSQNSRIYDLLELYNLSDRVYNKDMDLLHINYTYIKDKLTMTRDESINFLINSIEK